MSTYRSRSVPSARRPIGHPDAQRGSGVIGRIGLVMLVVADLARSVRYYRDVIGFRVRYSSQTWTELDGGGVSLALHAAGPDVGVNPSTGCTFALLVDDAADATRKLREQGSVVLQEPRQEPIGAVLAVISDPDGYRIHLLELPDADV